MEEDTVTYSRNGIDSDYPIVNISRVTMDNS